jgi:hypothetical protein
MCFQHGADAPLDIRAAPGYGVGRKGWLGPEMPGPEAGNGREVQLGNAPRKAYPRGSLV